MRASGGIAEGDVLAGAPDADVVAELDVARVAVAQPDDRAGDAADVVGQARELGQAGRGHLRRDGARVVVARAALRVAPGVGLDVQHDRLRRGRGGALKERPQVGEPGRHRGSRGEVDDRLAALVGLGVARRGLQEHVVRERRQHAVRAGVRDVGGHERAVAVRERLPALAGVRAARQVVVAQPDRRLAPQRRRRRARGRARRAGPWRATLAAARSRRRSRPARRRRRPRLRTRRCLRTSPCAAVSRARRRARRSARRRLRARSRRSRRRSR